MDFFKTQETLIKLLPLWQNKIARPFKQILDEGITYEMYNCMQYLVWFEDGIAMSELAKALQLPKQQATKLVNRLVENGFAERRSEQGDRRVIKVVLTDKAKEYIEKVTSCNIESYKKSFKNMDIREMEEFQAAIETLFRILSKDI